MLSLRTAVPLAPALFLATSALGAQARDSLPPADSVFWVEPLLVTASRLPGAGARLGLTVTSRAVKPSDSPYVDRKSVV